MKYRWTVYVKATIAKTSDLSSALTQEASYPVFLDFDHERDPEAAAAVRSTDHGSGDTAGDDLIADMTSSHASADARAPQRGVANGDSIYFVLVDRFANGDPSNDGVVDRADPQAFHGGDLQGVLEHLDDLQRLGVGAVWLSPVFKMRTEKLHGHGAYHGYWVDDFTSVDPRFGETALLHGSRMSCTDAE